MQRCFKCFNLNFRLYKYCNKVDWLVCIINKVHMTLARNNECMLPEEDLRIETCRSVSNVLM
jgi:hypothetical protein